MSNDIARVLAVRAAELIGDGEWYDFEHTRGELMKAIPPGIAMRRHAHILSQAGAQRRRQGRPAGYRRPPAPPEERIRSGARDLVREFLGNRNVFQLDTPLPPRRPQGPIERRIRMIKRHRLITDEEWQRLRAERGERKIQILEQQVLDLKKYLVQIGHIDAAERLAP